MSNTNELVRFQPITNNTRFTASFVDTARQHGYDGRLLSFSLPAAHTCPYADECFSSADRHTGKITDGPNMTYRCYAATNERYPGVRDQRWNNYDLLQSAITDRNREQHADVLALLLERSLTTAGVPRGTRAVVRLHPSGDMYSLAYFAAWCRVAGERASSLFYVFTKSIPLWMRLRNAESIPDNLRIIGSVGGKADGLIYQHGLRYSRVIDNESHADELGLTLDYDDTVAAFGTSNIGLPILGTQPRAIRLRVQGQPPLGMVAD